MKEIMGTKPPATTMVIMTIITCRFTTKIIKQPIIGPIAGATRTDTIQDISTDTTMDFMTPDFMDLPHFQSD